MIFIHEGNPGAGKSYDVVRRIIEALQKGRKVYTNVDGMDDPQCLLAMSELFDIPFDDLRARLVFLTEQQVSCFWDHVEPGSFIVLDEIHKWFNSRDWSKDSNRAFSDWASTHRHHGFDVALITQRSSKIDSQVRTLADWRFFYRRMNMFGNIFSKKYLYYVYAGDDTKPLGPPKTCTYDTRIFKCYHSYQGGAVEKTVVKNPNVFKHPAFYALAAVALLTLYFFSRSSFSKGDVLGVAHVQEQVQTAIQATSQSSSVHASSIPSAPGQSLPASARVQPHGSLADAVQTRWVPVTAYIRLASGQEIVQVQGFRLDSWVQLSSDKSHALVRVSSCPDYIFTERREVSSFAYSSN